MLIDPNEPTVTADVICDVSYDQNGKRIVTSTWKGPEDGIFKARKSLLAMKFFRDVFAQFPWELVLVYENDEYFFFKRKVNNEIQSDKK